MEIYLVKTLGGVFKPSHDSDYQKFKKLKVDQTYVCKVSQPRNVKFHRKYFALINLVYSNQERYDNSDDLRHDLTIASGYYRRSVDLQGNEVKKAKSISFAKMTEFEFSELYSATLDAIVKYFGFDKEAMIEEIEQFF
jgi:hypothetical protein